MGNESHMMMKDEITKNDKFIAEFIGLLYDKESDIWTIPTDHWLEAIPGDWWHYYSYFKSDSM